MSILSTRIRHSVFDASQRQDRSCPSVSTGAFIRTRVFSIIPAYKRLCVYRVSTILEKRHIINTHSNLKCLFFALAQRLHAYNSVNTGINALKLFNQGIVQTKHNNFIKKGVLK